MSLWTPGGEHEVPREPAQPTAPARGPTDRPTTSWWPSLPPEDRARLESLGPEERERAMAQLRQMAQEMADVQRQMAEAPAAVVIANHAMGLYELATIHLRQQPPNLPEAKVAIDAFGALLESLKGRLGPDEPTLFQALDQLRMALSSSRRRPVRETGARTSSFVTVLVTGGAGYIGSHTVRLLRERGATSSCSTAWSSATAMRCSARRSSRAHIDDGELVQRMVAEHGIESVIHFAAYKAAGESMEQPARYFANNVGGTNALLDALRLAGVDKVVFSSTCAVYGTPTKLPGRRSPLARAREPLRREQAHGRADARLVRHVPRPPVGEPALLQRGRRVGRRSHRRGLDLHAEPRPAGDEGGARSHPVGRGVRHRLRHARRHRDPRLRARRGSRRRPPAGPRVPRGRRDEHRHQPRHRQGILGP